MHVLHALSARLLQARHQADAIGLAVSFTIEAAQVQDVLAQHLQLANQRYLARTHTNQLRTANTSIRVNY
jgi:hypothetical protein